MLKAMKPILCSLAALLMLPACSGRKRPGGMWQEQEVAFEVAGNYFFRQGQQIPKSPKVTSADEFARLFGTAATMGPGGQPTEIDFDKQFVLAIVLPATDVETEVVPLNLVAKGNTLYYFFQVEMGEQQSFRMQPLSIIIVDKKYAGMEVSLVNQQAM